MIWSIRERSAFTRLSREGKRTRAGTLWCTYVLDTQATPPRVAYAIGRAVGPAVVRNRVRRRLRSLVAARQLEPGWYLIGAGPAAVERSFAELTFDLQRLLPNPHPRHESRPS